MSTPTFAKNHNLISYLAKPTESEGFEQIIDFLTGRSVNYALTASPTIRTSYIKQFWTTTKCLSAKTTSWNEFSSTMASVIICLATNQKFNFSRYILLRLVKNIAARVPFFMLPRVVTPLFDTMLVPAAQEVGLIQDDVQSTTIPTKPSISKPYKKHKPKKQQPQEHKVPSPKPSPEHLLPSPSNDPLPGGEDSLKLKELIDLCAHLSNKVLELENEVIDIKSTYKERNKELEGKVLSMQDVDDDEHADVEEFLEVVKAPKLMTEVVTTAGETTTTEAIKVNVLKRRKGVVIQYPEETASIVVVHFELYKGKPLTEAQARKNMIIYLKNMAGFKMNYFKGMAYIKIRPLFEKHYNYNQAFLEEVNEEVTVPEKEVEVKCHKREGKSIKNEITKKQKIDEEAGELKSHLQIVANDDDDVYT
uniref:Uncharacterized protein n=1 Tax=Tanacetum cinerariifolium TaxID=118510 RepID=A0A699H630_TANCI|nr:hypothetical protein [Tanacetum cinerariifolium]